MTVIRCSWANPANPRYLAYHDEEWGVPCRDENRLFEMLNLEGAQAGLSWETVLNKRDHYRRVFDDMPDPALWSFSFDVASIDPATPLRVTRTQNSAAAYVFSTVHRVYQFSDGFYAPETPERTLVWMDVNTQ